MIKINITEHSSGLTAPAYDWLVTCNCLERILSLYIAVEWTWTYSKQITWSLSSQSIGVSVGSAENTASSTVAWWTMFTELLPGNSSIKSLKYNTDGDSAFQSMHHLSVGMLHTFRRYASICRVLHTWQGV
jgi:hypothetical protein